MKIRRSFQRVLLSLLLLLSQQMGIAHAVSHLSDGRQDGRQKTSQNKQLPIEQACEQCLAYAQLGSGLTSAPALPLLQAATSLVIDSTTAQYFSPRTVYAFQSRAPPQ